VPRADVVRVAVDWRRTLGPVPPRAFGLNLFRGFSLTGGPNEAAYRANVAYLAPGIVRYHHAGAMQDSRKAVEGLLNEANRTWDAAKIKRTLSASLGAHQRPERMVNIPGWPAWMDKNGDGRLDPDQFDAYARLCADLVRIVNRDARLGVRWWEVTNEKDDVYFTRFYENGGWGALKKPAEPDRVAELTDLFNRCARAMKQADPTIKVGGPAAARPDLVTFHERFLKGTLPNLDFFTFHAYASGSAATSDEEIYDRASGMGGFVKAVVDMARRLSPTRRIPVFLGEYNISWTWETRDPRMTNHKGVVFDALALTAACEAGADGSLAWNEKDGIYGKTGNADERHPAASLFHLANSYLAPGERVQSTTSNPKTVVAFAVRQPAQRRRALLLINRSDAPQTVALNVAGGGPLRTQNTVQHEISAAGYAARPMNAAAAALILPPHSVTLLTTTGK